MKQVDQKKQRGRAEQRVMVYKPMWGHERNNESSKDLFVITNQTWQESIHTTCKQNTARWLALGKLRPAWHKFANQTHRKDKLVKEQCSWAIDLLGNKEKSHESDV